MTLSGNETAAFCLVFQRLNRQLHGLCTQLQIWRMCEILRLLQTKLNHCEILRLLQTKLNHTEPVHAVPMCLPNTCSLADTPFALAQKTTNEYFVQAAPSFRRSAAGLSTSNSYGICREESGNGKIFLRALPLSVPFHENPISIYACINDIL